MLFQVDFCPTTETRTDKTTDRWGGREEISREQNYIGWATIDLLGISGLHTTNFWASTNSTEIAALAWRLYYCCAGESPASTIGERNGFQIVFGFTKISVRDAQTLCTLQHPCRASVPRLTVAEIPLQGPTLGRPRRPAAQRQQGYLKDASLSHKTGPTSPV